MQQPPNNKMISNFKYLVSQRPIEDCQPTTDKMISNFKYLLNQQPIEDHPCNMLESFCIFILVVTKLYKYLIRSTKLIRFFQICQTSPVQAGKDYRIKQSLGLNVMPT